VRECLRRRSTPPLLLSPERCHRFASASKWTNVGWLKSWKSLGGWTAKHIHQVVLESFQLSQKAYGLNQLRYDLRKLKGHGLLERDGSRYAYRLTTKGIQVALLFLFFHKRLCGPLAYSRFHHRPDASHQPRSKLEGAYHKADTAIQDIVELLAAAWSRSFKS
jgi:hypothetical protein